MLAISWMASLKAASLALEGLVKPLIFRTYWDDAARISSSVAGGSKLNRVLMFLHMSLLTACHSSHDEKRGGARCDRIGEWRIWQFVREILLAGEEAHKRAAL